MASQPHIKTEGGELAPSAATDPIYIGAAALLDQPQVSVVIPCLNEEEAVGKVVDQALAGFDESGRTGEVIVVDNGSTDGSAAIAAAHGAVVVSEPRRGYGSAYLAGLEAARGEYLVMGDADDTYPLDASAGSSTAWRAATTSSSAPASRERSTATRCPSSTASSETRCSPGCSTSSSE